MIQLGVLVGQAVARIPGRARELRVAPAETLADVGVLQFKDG
jgi:hypothetical protein